MAPKWTDGQLDAINASGRAIVVSAAAGSGKTAVLVEKLRRLLCDEENRVPADRIVVVTFTNDAAAQMKQRLSKAIGEELEKKPGSRWLLSQAALIPSAKISTIHSFCFNLIRENAGLAGVDSGFSVLTPDDEELITAKAAANVFEKWFSFRRKEMRMLTSFFCPGESSERRFAEIVPILREKILALPFPLHYMDTVAESYEKPAEESEMFRLYKDYIRKELSRAAGMLKVVYEEIGDYNTAFGNPCNELVAVLEREYEAVRELADGAQITDEPCHLDFELIKTIPAAVMPKGSDRKTDKTVQSALGKLRNEAIAICGKFCTVTVSNEKAAETSQPDMFFSRKHIYDDFAIHAKICRSLFDLIKDVLVEERRIKDEKNGLGFSDAEQIACSLLCSETDGIPEKTELARSLSDYYAIVMIDEFQDSTKVQELIFRMLSKDGSAEAAGTNFFAVGDVKQSIYRFRCADPGIFMENIRRSVPYADDGGDSPAYILLNRNFRSSGYTVDFVNTVFDRIMSEKHGGVDYDEDSRLVMGADIPDDFGPTEIINVGNPPKTAASKRVAPSDYYRFEAKLVAARIKKLLEMNINDDNGVRRVQPSDICILSRSAKHFHLYIAALKELGVEASGSAETSYLESAEILTLVNLLRSIDNPTLDIPLTAVLMSPMFMFTAEDMGRLGTLGTGSVYGNISALCRADEEAAFTRADADMYPAVLVQKCREFLRDFAALRRYAAAHSIAELIEYIYDSTDFMSVVSILKDSAKKKANLRLLPVFASAYDKNGTGGLSGFVRQINNMLASGKDFSGASAAVSGESAVSVKTIHASKGLEYPFVFLCGTWQEFHGERSTMRTLRDRVSFFPDCGAGFYINRRDDETGEYMGYDSFPRRAVSIALEKSSADEEMMIFYVALTRAKNKMFITRRTDSSACVNRYCIKLLETNGPKQDLAAAYGSSLADWLSAAIPDDKLSELAASGAVSIKNAEDILDDDTADEAVVQEGDAEFSEECAAEYDRLIGFSYDLTASNTSAKLTVSEIAKNHTDISERIFAVPSKTEPSPSGISAADRGTAVHAFMQYADFEKLYAARNGGVNDTVKAETERLFSLGYLNEAQTKCISSGMIGKFVSGGLFERLMNSPEIIRERKFLVKISDLNLDDDDLMVYNGTEGMLQGVADCLYRDGDGYVLLDYKTDRNVTPEILVQRYKRQLFLYARAFSMILDLPVTKAYLYSFSLGREIEIEL